MSYNLFKKSDLLIAQFDSKMFVFVCFRGKVQFVNLFRLNFSISRLRVHWAYFYVLGCEVEAINKAKCLFKRATVCILVDQHCFDLYILIYDE